MKTFQIVLTSGMYKNNRKNNLYPVYMNFMWLYLSFSYISIFLCSFKEWYFSFSLHIPPILFTKIRILPWLSLEEILRNSLIS